MSRKKKTGDEDNEGDKKITFDMDDRSAFQGKLKCLGGSMFNEWNKLLVDDVNTTLWTQHRDEEERAMQARASAGALIGIEPRDELEGMIAAQLLAAHHAAMECYRRAMIPDQTFAGRAEALNQANKLSRTWESLLNALNKHRGKGQQKMTVEHVHVHDGGQAIVGTVERPEKGEKISTEEQTHAEQIADAPEPEVWCEDTARHPVPVAGDVER